MVPTPTYICHLQMTVTISAFALFSAEVLLRSSSPIISNHFLRVRETPVAGATATLYFP
jgi:hypothetical protein